MFGRFIVNEKWNGDIQENWKARATPRMVADRNTNITKDITMQRHRLFSTASPIESPACEKQKKNR